MSFERCTLGCRSFFRPRGLLTAVGIMVLLGAAWSQSATEAEYVAALGKSGAARIQALERFVTTHPGTPWEPGARTLLAWSHYEEQQFARALDVARQVVSSDANNVVSLAIIAQQLRHASGAKRNAAEELRRTAERGLTAYQTFVLPQGISTLEGYMIKRRTLAMLEAALGYAAFQQNDYSTAQTYLRQALAIEPNNGENLYALGLADLAAKPANKEEGFLALAQTVKLYERTAAGASIAAFGKQQYLDAGGTAQDWNRYLIAVGTSPIPAPATPPTSVPATRDEGRREPPAKAAAPTPSRAKAEAAKLDVPELPPLPRVDTTEPTIIPKPRPSTSGPVSLGIVIEASKARDRRDQIARGLIDMLGYLRSGDEAFILAFGDKLDFTEDLTGSPRLLEDALMKLRPQPGAALVDAVGVAAGHLNRIAKNPNRVLLVISDGRNDSDRKAASLLETNLDTVRVYCIGIGVSNSAEQQMLSALAQRTGGVAAFVSSTDQFGAASAQIARNIYVGGM